MEQLISTESIELIHDLVVEHGPGIIEVRGLDLAHTKPVLTQYTHMVTMSSKHILLFDQLTTMDYLFSGYLTAHINYTNNLDIKVKEIEKILVNDETLSQLLIKGEVSFEVLDYYNNAISDLDSVDEQGNAVYGNTGFDITTLVEKPNKDDLLHGIIFSLESLEVHMEKTITCIAFNNLQEMLTYGEIIDLMQALQNHRPDLFYIFAYIREPREPEGFNEVLAGCVKVGKSKDTQELTRTLFLKKETMQEVTAHIIKKDNN